MVMFICVVVLKLLFGVTTCCNNFLFQSFEHATLHIFSQAKRSKLSEPLKGVLSELAKLKESASLASQLEEESQHGGKSTQGGKFT